LGLPPALAWRSRLCLFPVRSAAHYRLSWEERLAHNARAPTAGRVTIRLFGVPEDFATSLGLVAA
jgi:hypothetical protein